MIDIVITILLIVAVGISILYELKVENSDSIFEINRTYAFEYLFSIIIIFVHIPSSYQNAIQDIIGSFAYIGVSFFCMKTAYGVKYSYSNKRDYLKHFWGTRLFKIATPLLAIAIIDIIRCNVMGDFSKPCLVYYDTIYGWIRVLLLLYLEFYFIYSVTDKIGNSSLIGCRDVILAALIIAQSIIDYLWHFNLIQGWNIERIGFVVGIMLFNHSKETKAFVEKKYSVMLAISCAATVAIGLLYIKFKLFGFVGGYIIRGLLEIAFLFLVVVVMQKFKFNNTVTRIGGAFRMEHMCAIH